MNKLLRKAAAWVLSAAMALSMAAVPAFAANTAPSTAPECEVTSGISSQLVTMKFTQNEQDWFNAIESVTVDGTAYEKSDSSPTFNYGQNYWYAGTVTGAYGREYALQLTENFASSPAAVVVKAADYPDVTITLTKSGSGYTAELSTAQQPEPEPSTKPEEGRKLQPPTSYQVEANFGYDFQFTFESGAESYLSAITGVTVNGTAWNRASNSYGVWNSKDYYVGASSLRLVIGEAFDENPATCVITAEGYEDLTLSLDKDTHQATVVDTAPKTYAVTAKTAEHGTITVSPAAAEAGATVTITAAPEEGYALESLTVAQADGTAVELAAENTFVMPASDVTVEGTFAAISLKKLELSEVSLSVDSFGHDWLLSFSDEGYLAAVTGVTVNGTTWGEKAYAPSSGGCYQKDTEHQQLVFSKVDFSAESEIPVLKSGDVITIQAKGYEDLTMKLVVDPAGKGTLTEDDGKGDPYHLYVKLEGGFEAAITGQKEYDGVSGATGAASSNQNSNVTVYGALVEGDKQPEDQDWEELDHLSQIQVEGSKSSVNIVPDTANGTAAESDCGMEGVYMTQSSSLTLSGTPKDPGTYLVSVTITDNQGRTATSNVLPFRVYSGQETLADQISEKNLTQTQDGKYMWDIMEPWAISQFGSNVTGEENAVRVPAGLKAWYGSHESGTYGYLGYDLDWKKVEAGEIPQTLYIPDGCNLTLVNMEILSSVRIVVENGGTLCLRDSVVQGIVDVQSGGTFSMNYNDYGEGEFLTGASICGQLRLADGAVLENAAIYSHINYLANGDLVDRSSSEPVVTTEGNVTVKGKVFIEGDEAASDIGQTALRVSGTLTLADDAVLAVYGGGAKVSVYAQGGTALELADGAVTGNGKLIALGGAALFGDGGNAVSGKGTISVPDAFLQGATAYGTKATAGKALAGSDVTVTSTKRSVKDGENVEMGKDDPLYALYWRTGIEPTPDLSLYKTEDYQEPDPDPNPAPEPDPNPDPDPTPDPDPAPSVSFKDVPESSWCYDAVQWAVEKKVTLGKTEDIFAPGEKLTRGQMVTFLWRAAGSPEPQGKTNPFTDVAAGSHYEKAILWAVEQGITNGTTATTFAPNDACTRAQTVTFLWRAAGKPQVETETKFRDLRANAYYYDAVQWAAQNNITKGMSDGKFQPDTVCSRGQGVTFLYRAHEILK